MNFWYKSLAMAKWRAGEADAGVCWNDTCIYTYDAIAVRVYGVANSEEQQAFLGWRRAMR
jgi:hypothetical protein